MEVKYQIFEKENLFIHKFSGLFSLEDYKRYSHFILEKTRAKNIKKVLIDLRNLEVSEMFDTEYEEFLSTIDQVAEIRKEENTRIRNMKEIVHVFWVDQPHSTVMANLFIRNFPGIVYHYCSTAESIVLLFNLPTHLQNLEQVVNNLKNTF